MARDNAAKDTPTKTVGVKSVGANKSIETIILSPGNTVADALKMLGLGGGYQLSNSRNPGIVFGPADALYALVEDGDLLHASAMVDAGNKTMAEDCHEPA